MNRRTPWFGMVLVLVQLLTTLPGAQLAQAKLAADDVAAQIGNAEQAAPAMISHAATILGWDEQGLPTVVLRKGNNDWTCYADWPASPGNDPACYDSLFNAWNAARRAGKQPDAKQTGIAYKLQGGSDPSNSDPSASQPAAGQTWISTPPHLLIITPVGFNADDYASEPKADQPYIRWDDTPFEQLVVPVVPTTDQEIKTAFGDVDGATANLLRSAPAGVTLHATIMGYSDKAGGAQVVTQPGTNGWICYPDGISSPGNDPSCNDPMMDAFWSLGDTQSVKRVGLSYMLQGGSDPSNDDPSLTSPRTGEAWVMTPPHVMLVIPGGFDEKHFTTDHKSGFPYLMYSDTGYEHLMIPLTDMAGMAQDADPLAEMQQRQNEAMGKEAHTFDLLLAHDWPSYEAVLAPTFYQINAEGIYVERDAVLAALQDEKLVMRPPDLGEMRVAMLTPDAYLVTYPLNLNGSYAGVDFSQPRTVSSLWVKTADQWLRSFQVEQSRSAPLMRSTAGRIANAESAGPAAVAHKATIMGWDKEGLPSVLLRPGSNDWTCYEDQPASPDNDPACYDTIFSAWVQARLAGEQPEIKATGIGYRLQGSSEASASDPSATQPADGEQWISTPPHVMILSASGFNASLYGTTASAKDPYIRWDGTSYEHLIQPVLPIEQAVLISTLDDPIAQEVMLAEQQLNYAADFLHDIDTARLMLADDYTEKSSGSRLVKEEKLAWIKSAVYMGQQAKFATPSVKIEGDRATISFKLEATGVYQGNPYDSGSSPVTNIWVKRDGRWQMLNGG